MKRLGWSALLVLVSAAGCGELRTLLDDIRDNHGHGGSTGAGGSTGGGTGGGAGGSTGGSGGGAATCDTLALGTAFAVAPAPDGQSYTRCDTLGPERDWRVTLSPDGRYLAARTGAGTVRLIDTQQWREVGQFASPMGALDAVAFSPDGTKLATVASEMGGITLWNTGDGALARGYAGPPVPTIGTFDMTAAFSADGTRLATALHTVLNLATGVSTDWDTGATTLHTLTVNPQIGRGTWDATHLIRFLPDDRRLFTLGDYRVGNSNLTRLVTVRDPQTASRVLLQEMFTTETGGVAISNDGQRIVVGALVTDPGAGLVMFRTADMSRVANDPTVSPFLPQQAEVLAFSPDGSRFYLRTGRRVAVRDSNTLQELSSFLWPEGTVFLGSSPQGALVTSNGGTATSWWDGNGNVLRTVPYPLTSVTWSADGRFGAGSGDPAALFHFWREPDGAEACAPPVRGEAAPALATLGGAASADGSVVTTDEFVIHTSATDWTVLHVRDAYSGADLRLFGPAPEPRPYAISASGDRLFTAEGPDVAVWCR